MYETILLPPQRIIMCEGERMSKASLSPIYETSDTESIGSNCSEFSETVHALEYEFGPDDEEERPPQV